MPFMYCEPPAAIVSIRRPVDATHAGAGHVILASGATFEIDANGPADRTSEGGSFVVHLRKTDRVQLCYAPPQHFADAGARARMAIAGNLRSEAYLYTLAYPAPTRP